MKYLAIERENSPVNWTNEEELLFREAIRIKDLMDKGKVCEIFFLKINQEC